MNSGKKTTAMIVAVVAIIAIVIIVFAGKPSDDINPPINTGSNASSTGALPVSETTKISNSFSEYKNAELGFSVKYPSAWEKGEANSGVNFVIPIDKTQVSTVATMQANVQLDSRSCDFPPVPIIKDRGTIKVGNDTLNTISISNTVQNRNYYTRMYSLSKNNVCYMFTFASITSLPSSKGLTGSQITQAENNNKAIVSSTEEDFTSMVKSFTFIQGPEGKDETKVSPAK